MKCILGEKEKVESIYKHEKIISKLNKKEHRFQLNLTNYNDVL